MLVEATCGHGQRERTCAILGAPDITARVVSLMDGRKEFSMKVCT